MVGGTSSYFLTVDAPNTLDAIDKAKRRAREDGYRPVAVESCKRDALGRWALVLLVEPIRPPG